jgi:hypothetical protein
LSSFRTRVKVFWRKKDFFLLDIRSRSALCCGRPAVLVQWTVHGTVLSSQSNGPSPSVRWLNP